VPDHELIRCIGRGSYGEVWLARGVLGKLRAVKVVYRDRFADARPYEREFTGILRVEPLSRIHDGLVDILHVGRHEPEGYFYYVMELADDATEDESPRRRGVDSVATYQPRTLARELKRRKSLGFQDCVHLGLNLSGALSELHQGGLIHRDVKPSNILYVGGVPKLGDIGLVGEAGASGSYVGTEGYIPPEGPGTPQADLFSLGKVLYEAGTGRDRLEFPALPIGAMDDPARAQLAELNAILLRACAPDPRARYRSAEELHADLAVLHRGQSVRGLRRKERRWQWLSVAGYAGAAVVGLLAGALWSPWQRPAGGSIAASESLAAPLPEQSPVDLSAFYNASPGSNWLQDFVGNDLADLPTGRQRFGPAYFEVRGLIQLDGVYTEQRQLGFPDAVSEIPVNRRCARLHFLHGTAWAAADRFHVGSYVVHYADGRKEEIPLRYGEAFRNWWWNPQSPLSVNLATLAWQGSNKAIEPTERLCLFALTWNNPFPGTPVARLDFCSTHSSSCPFLIAVTAE
jgi:serine/threonine protein kinase